MSKPTQTGKIRRAYEFIKAHRHQHVVRTMCRVLDVAAMIGGASAGPTG